MKRNLIGLAAAVLLVVSGCGASVNSTMAPNVNLSQYRTFGWYTPATGAKPQSLADQEIRAALQRSLAAKGIVEATTGKPDFLVAYHTIMQQEAAPDYGYGYYGGWGGDAYTYTQGTLVVDFIDPQQRKVFWRGTASQVVNDPNNVDRKKLDDAVSKLVKQYPANVAQAPGSPPPM
ncbi:MAG TPA: DUF4136 domain-containing protein [Polyangia bacterium]|jgi:hypothetical protein